MNTSLVLSFAEGQERKEKPTLMGHLTLLDIVANGTSIRLFREKATIPDAGNFTLKLTVVRRQRGRGWMSVQKMLPAVPL
ncbi:hypothetical protein QM042_02150 [Escherichia coli]|uniref:hypothetical protein n=1 Tax=Escherichia coli TaxID=562 RepID=UPI003985E8DC